MLHVKDAAIGGSPAWSSLREIPAMIAYAPHLRRTLGIALVVGSLFVLMNQLGALLSGQATPTVWMKAALTYVVPFCVSNYGMLTATHRSRNKSTSAATACAWQPRRGLNNVRIDHARPRQAGGVA